MGEALPCSAHTGRVCIPPTRKQALKRLENATGSTRISIFLVSVPKRLVSRRVESEPDWRALPAKTPAKIRELLRRCLKKDAARRLLNISEARRTIEQARRGWNRWAIASVAAVLLAGVAVGGALWLRPSTPISDPANWVQVTKFPDSVAQPALSPDGKMLAFIRGQDTFATPGEIYVKILPTANPNSSHTTAR